MSVVAKYFVQSVTLQANSKGADGGDVGSVQLSVVCRGDENKNWSHYTPSGQITMSTLNPKAFAWFKENLGKEVYVDFTLAEGVTETTNEDGSMVSRTLPDAGER